MRDEPSRSNSPRGDHAQQLRLLRRRHVRDFVEEQRSAVGELEAAHAIGARVGKRAAHVAEQLALEHRFGDAARVHRHHRARRARRQRVNGLGDEPFARAVLACNQHVRVRRRRPLDELDDGLHRRRSRNQRRRAVEAQARRALELPPAAQRAAQLDLRSDNREQPRVVPRLLHEVARAAAHRLDRDIDARPRGQHDDRQRRILGLQPREQVEPFLARRRIARVIQIDERGVEVRFGDGREHGGRRRHGLHLEPLALQEQLKGFENVALIVGKKDAGDT